MDMKNLIEVLLFATPEPLTQVRFSQIIQDEDSVELDSIIDKLNLEYEKSGKGLKIQKIGGGYQVLSLSEYHIFIERMFQKTRKLQLSRPALEALSIVAYRQPVSKAEMESIRGVECGSVLSTLMERELITVKGRGKTAGRPLLFGTTQIFLESFGLEKTTDLPKLKELSELMGDNPDPVLFENDHASE